MAYLQNIKFYYGREIFRIPVKTKLVQLPIRTSLYVTATFQQQQLWAECSAFEKDWYESETWPKIYQQLKKYKTELEKIKIDGAWYNELCQILTFNHAKDVIDYLMWQAFAISQQQTLTQLLSKKSIIECGITVSTPSIDKFRQLLPDIQRYPRVKLKWHQHLNVFIEQLPTDIMIAIDANGQLDDNHFTDLAKLSQYNIAYIEQPFNHKQLYNKFKKSGIPIQIAIDESAINQQEIQSFIEHQLTDIICLKHGRLGGISSIKNIIEQCKSAYFAGGMYEINHAQYETAIIQSMLQTKYPADLATNYFINKNKVHIEGKYNLLTQKLDFIHQLIEL